MKDDLGKRMKEQYEIRTRTLLPRRTYTIIRLDGKAFHTLTRSCRKPFDRVLMRCMQETAKELCKEIQGAKFAYVQSDEISILLTDFETITTDAWFDGQVQKMCSVSASIATRAFNKATHDCLGQALHGSNALFDSRVFTIPDPIEVENYFKWRQQDATRNSVSMLAQSLYSHKELQGKNSSDMQEMCFQKGKNWNDCAFDEKRGAVIKKETYMVPLNGEHDEIQMELDIRMGTVTTQVERSRWVVDKDTPVFTQDPNYLKNMIPRIS